MKYGLIGTLIPMLADRPVYEYTSGALPGMDMKAFRKAHRREYRAMISRTPGAGGVKENMLAIVMYLACYDFSYYKAGGEGMTEAVFEGMIDALCRSDVMKKMYKNKDCFAREEIDKYIRGAERS